MRQRIHDICVDIILYIIVCIFEKQRNIYVCIYMYIYRERDREIGLALEAASLDLGVHFGKKTKAQAAEHTSCL